MNQSLSDRLRRAELIIRHRRKLRHGNATVLLPCDGNKERFEWSSRIKPNK